MSDKMQRHSTTRPCCGSPELSDDPHYREYRERCQSGEKSEDDEEIYES